MPEFVYEKTDYKDQSVHPIFDLQPYVELDEAVKALEEFEKLEISG